MALKLYINYDTSGELQEADLYPDEGIKIKQRLISENGVLNSTVEFTKDFDIPATPKNNLLLGHYENKGVVSTVNPNKSISARIEIDNMKVYYGSLEIISVSWKKGRPYNYKVVFYGSASGLKVALGDTKLSDIDWSDFEVTMTSANVSGTWNTTGLTYIPIISWVRPYRWYSTSSSPANANDITSNGVLMDELRVGMRLIDFIGRIFSHIGATAIFAGNTSAYFNRAYIIPSNRKVITQDQTPFEIDVEGTGLSCGDAVSTLSLPTENSDPANSWTSNTLFTPTFTGSHTFKIDYDLTSGTNVKKEIRVVNNGTGSTVNTSLAAGSSGSVFITANLVASTAYRFDWIDALTTGSTNTYDVRLRTYSIPVTIYNRTYDPSLYMPDKYASDFLSEFLKAFNLDVIQDSEDVYLIKPVANIFDYDNLIDLNPYINQEVLTYEKLDVYSDIELKHQDTEDVSNDDFRSLYNRDFGTYDYESDFEFASEELSVESPFTVFPPNYIYEYNTSGDLTGITDLIHHYQLDDSEEPKPVLSDFLLMYRNDQITTEYTYKLQSGVDVSGKPTYTTYSVYPFYSQVADNIATVDSYTLTYGEETPPQGVTPENTIYQTYWSELIEQLYDNAAYKIKVSFRADMGLFFKLDKTALCFFKGFYHFISQFEYSTASKSITLELTKLKVSPNTLVLPESSNITTEGSDPIITEGSDNITTE